MLQSIEVLHVVSVHRRTGIAVEPGGEELVVRVEVFDQFIRVLPSRCGEENDLTQRRAVLQEIAQIGTLTRPDGERLSVELDLDMISRG